MFSDGNAILKDMFCLVEWIYLEEDLMVSKSIEKGQIYLGADR